jgi:hypothetical protein
LWNNNVELELFYTTGRKKEKELTDEGEGTMHATLVN